MNFIGIDPGYNTTAFVLFHGTDKHNTGTYINSRISKKTKSFKKSDGVFVRDRKRSTELLADLFYFLDDNNIMPHNSRVFIEGLTGSQSSKAARMMVTAFYTIYTGLNSRKLNIVVVSPVAVKNFISGKRNASKYEVIRGVLETPDFAKWEGWPTKQKYEFFGVNPEKISDDYLKKVLLLGVAEHVADAAAALLYGRREFSKKGGIK